MSMGSDLLKLQETDLELERERIALNNLPLIAELAKKRSAHAKLKAEPRACSPRARTPKSPWTILMSRACMSRGGGGSPDTSHRRQRPPCAPRS